MTWKGIVGKRFTLEAFAAHVAALQFNGWTPSFVVVHNTSAPTVKQYQDWLRRPGWTPEQWARNLESYYIGQGWSAGPHAFVTPDGGVLAFTPFTIPGTHSPAWNSRTWGIETVGEFMTEEFSPVIRNTLVACLGILHARVGLDPADYKFGVRGIHFHKEDPKTTHKECPGVHIVKADLVAGVADYIEGLHPGVHDHVPAAVHTAPTDHLSAEELGSVAWLQDALNKTGAAPPLAVDGGAGPATRAAVLAFQRASNLVMDGIAGPVTRLALVKALA